MPNISSYADIVRDWEQLLTSTEENAAEIPGAEEHRAALAEHLTAVKALKAKQDSARAEKQEITRQLRQKVTDGRDHAIRLRDVVRAGMGPRSERLVKFGMAPLRKRRRGEKQPTESGPSDGPTIPPAGGSKPEVVN